ncbi:hypothetical protein OPV22_017938 [Ensete ventricosum]|uniref:Uncharacterized protein n=1 Tax=Ensete ventricosum TaxID=4639 RepID=A0AAV8QXI6_ENSVE|nr:hypothetical protein OPV22_017938 [Ensete ventricosum]
MAPWVFFFMDLLELGRLLLARAIASSIDANFLKVNLLQLNVGTSSFLFSFY